MGSVNMAAKNVVGKFILRWLWRVRIVSGLDITLTHSVYLGLHLHARMTLQLPLLLLGLNLKKQHQATYLNVLLNGQIRIHHAQMIWNVPMEWRSVVGR